MLLEQLEGVPPVATTAPALVDHVWRAPVRIEELSNAQPPLPNVRAVVRRVEKYVQHCMIESLGVCA
jgi:hypothetical protein